MKIQIDKELTFEVTFSPFNREEGYEDDIRFAIFEKQSGPIQMLAADSISVLLTPDQAEQLARALLSAAQESRNV